MSWWCCSEETFGGPGSWSGSDRRASPWELTRTCLKVLTHPINAPLTGQSAVWMKTACQVDRSELSRTDPVHVRFWVLILNLPNPGSGLCDWQEPYVSFGLHRFYHYSSVGEKNSDKKL